LGVYGTYRDKKVVSVFVPFFVRRFTQRKPCGQKIFAIHFEGLLALNQASQQQFGQQVCQHQNHGAAAGDCYIITVVQRPPVAAIPTNNSCLPHRYWMIWSMPSSRDYAGRHPRRARPTGIIARTAYDRVIAQQNRPIPCRHRRRHPTNRRRPSPAQIVASPSPEIIAPCAETTDHPPFS
jgi:hypothetical protein